MTTLPTIAPLLRLKEIDSDFYVKIEYLHPSGSLKHRAIPPFLKAMFDQGKIKPRQRIAIRSAGSAAITTAWAGAQLGCPVTAVLPPTTSKEKVELIKWYGAEHMIVTSEEATKQMIKFKEDGETYVLPQAAEPGLIEYYRPVAKEILAELPSAKAICVGIGTGLSITGMGRAVKESKTECKVIGVEPEESPIASGRPHAPHHIPGLAPPVPQPLLDKSVIDRIVLVSSREAWDCARDFARKFGLILGPSSGATVKAALKLRSEGFKGPVVAICSSSLYEYTGEIF